MLIALSLISSSACGEELDPLADAKLDVRDSDAGNGGVPDAQPVADAALPDTQSDAQPLDAGSEDAGLVSCGPAQDGVFVARVIDPGQSSQPIAGISTIVVDDVTGLPIVPSIQRAPSASERRETQ